jgi:inhibitor of cysteine peptidase
MLSSLAVYADITVKNTDSASAKTNHSYNKQNSNISVDSSHPEFVIKLKSNPSTGYSWYLREYDANLVVPTKHSFSKSSQPGLVGAPGYESWIFEVKPAGFIVPQQTLIRFVYARPWQAADDTTQLVFHVSTTR